MLNNREINISNYVKNARDARVVFGVNPAEFTTVTSRTITRGCTSDAGCEAFG